MSMLRPGGQLNAEEHWRSQSLLWKLLHPERMSLKVQPHLWISSPILPWLTGRQLVLPSQVWILVFTEKGES